MKRISKLERLIQQNNKPLAFIVTFALVGGITLFLVKAASPSSAFEAETTTKSGVTTITDASASNGSAIQFGNTSPTSGIASCDPSKGYAGELCWYQNTGVKNTTTADPNDRWTQVQITSGSASAQLDHVTAEVRLDGAEDFDSGSGTTENPWVYENHWVTGCITVETNNVIVRNVFLYMTYSGGNNCRPDPDGSHSASGFSSFDNVNVTFRDSEIDGLWSTSCAIPPWNNSCGETFNVSTNNVMVMTGNFTGRELNIHGGAANWGYIGGDTDASANIIDSYLHDVGHIHAFAAGSSSNCTGNDFHKENVHAQYASNWYINHSFFATWHDSWVATGNGTTGGCGSTAALMTGEHTSNWAIVNSFFDGQDTYDILSCNPGDHSKAVAQNVYLSPNGGLNTWGCDPSGFPDYQPGAWAPAFTTSPIGTQKPTITRSYCSNIYRVSLTGVATKVGC